MIVATIPNSMAQPDPSLGNWELGIEYPDEDDSNPFIVSEAGMASITMFVDNQAPLSVKAVIVCAPSKIPVSAHSSGRLISIIN